MLLPSTLLFLSPTSVSIEVYALDDPKIPCEFTVDGCSWDTARDPWGLDSRQDDREVGEPGEPWQPGDDGYGSNGNRPPAEGSGDKGTVYPPIEDNPEGEDPPVVL